MDIKNLLLCLCSLTQIGNINECTEYIEKELSGKAQLQKLDAGSVSATFKGESDKTLLLDAHIDQIGMIVTDVDDCGFVKVSNVGGIDAKTLPAKTVKILGKREIDAVFASVPPHLKKEETCISDITELTLDTGLGANAKNYISIGDYAVYKTTPAELLNGRVTAPFIDNRAGVAALIKLSDLLEGKKLPINVTMLFSTEEELGLRRARTSAYTLADNVDEAIAVDVTFATAPDVSKAHGGEMSKGAMIGVSPFLSGEVTDKLIKVAKEKEILFQREVMGSATSTNADAIGTVKGGIPTGLLSVPIRNMHTNVEVVDVLDIENTAKLLYEYIMAGGVSGC